MPAGRLRPWMAMSVSALAHLGVALALTGQPSRPAGESGGAAVAGRAMIVRLVAQPARPALPQPAPASQLASAPAVAAASARPDDAANPVQPHYFGPAAMTQAPVVAHGLIAGRLLVVPGIAPQTVALQVWISDEGAVERVALESPIAEEEERQLLAAFASVRFHPGRIGRIAVRSHLAMEIMLDDAIRL